jgi:SAM-dependent methyltransferase
VRPRLARAEGRHLFGTDPELYDAVRPGHPDEVYAILAERCGLGRGSKVLEVGPGTGQATRRLLELGASPLVALEPDPQLAAFLRARFGTRIVLVETALEDSALERAAFDLAAAASSFHWVDEETGLSRLRDALRPGGWIALWWTSFGDETRPDPFMEAIDPLFVDVPHSPSAPGDGRPSFARDAERRLAALADAGFHDQSHEELRWRHEWDATGIRGLYSTFSPIISLDPAHRDRMLASIERTAATQFGGRVSRPLVTSLYTARTPL